MPDIQLTTREKGIQIIDGVCGCLPIVSTFTSGAQALWKVAHKVDEVATPVKKPTWKTDFKIYLLNKPLSDCVIEMIPFLGNLTKLIQLVLRGFTNPPLVSAIYESNKEALQTYLRNNSLEKCTEKDAYWVLELSTKKIEDPELAQLVLDSRTWTVDSIAQALASSRYFPEKITEKFLSYYETHFTAQDADGKPKVLSNLGKVLEIFRSQGQKEKITKVLDLFPPCDFAYFESILADSANFVEEAYQLTPKHVQRILNLCQSCTLQQVTKYCTDTDLKASIIQSDLKYAVRNGQEEEKGVAENAMTLFRSHHRAIVRALLPKIVDLSNSSDLVLPFTALVQLGDEKLLEEFCNKYNTQMTVENQLAILNETSWKHNFLAGMTYFLKRYEKNFTDAQCMTLLKKFADLLLPQAPSVIDAFLKLRPGLTTAEGYTEMQDKFKESQEICQAAKGGKSQLSCVLSKSSKEEEE